MNEVINTNIRFPEGYVALKGYPGYFWNTKQQHLYTMKVTGELRPLSAQIATSKMLRRLRQHGTMKAMAMERYIQLDDPYFAISRGGTRRNLSIDFILNNLDFNHVIPLKAGY